MVKIVCQNCSSTPNDLSKMQLKLNQSTRNQFTPRRDDENPYITRNRQFSEQKPFSKLVASHGFPAPLIQSFSEDESDPKSSSDHDNPSGNLSSSKSTPDGKDLENDSVMSRSLRTNNEKSFKTSSQDLHVEAVEVVAEKSSSDNETLIEGATSSDAGLVKNFSVRKEMAQELRDRTEHTSFHLEELCCRWNTILEEEGGVPPDETGTVLTVIGQTQQLLKDRFVQYSDLIDQFETNSGIKKIEKEDLEGFWEMILLQVCIYG